MTLNEILTQDPKQVTFTEKVQQIGTAIRAARADFGNENEVINPPSVNTVSGVKPLKYTTDEDKCALAEEILKAIDVKAIEAATVVAGVTKALEEDAYAAKRLELIATDKTLCNITTKVTASKY